jgi:mono/diheme cytochrome c family protein
MRRGILVAGAVAIAAALGAAALWRGLGEPATRSAASPGMLALGAALYGEHCASCHGVELEGQPDWQRRLSSGRLPAPPHDASGHTWHHADSILFRIVRDGPAAIVGGAYESDMPGFADLMTDAEIEAVLAFIKSTWPERERAVQEQASIADDPA